MQNFLGKGNLKACSKYNRMLIHSTYKELCQVNKKREHFNRKMAKEVNSKWKLSQIANIDVKTCFSNLLLIREM